MTSSIRQTYSPSASGGHTRSSRPTGRCRFFESLADCFIAERLHQPKGNQPVSQQLQGPAAAAFRRLATGQLNDLFFEVAFDLDLVGSRGLRLRVESGLEALRDETLADASDGP